MAIVNVAPGANNISIRLWPDTYDGTMYQQVVWKLATSQTSGFADASYYTVIDENTVYTSYYHDVDIDFLAQENSYYALLQRNNSGIFVIRGDVLFAKIEPIDPPGQPTDLSPTDEDTLTSLSVDLSWTNGAETDSISVELGNETGTFGKIVSKDTACPEELTVTLSPNKVYFWRVVAHNAGGDTYSSTEHFKTPDIKPLPADLELGIPINGTVLTGELGITFTWENSIDAETASLQIGRQEGVFDTVISKRPARAEFGSNGTGGGDYDKAIVVLRPKTLYYWRIVNHNYEGEAFSETRSFTTPDADPKKPIIYSPKEGIKKQEFSSLDLLWYSDATGEDVSRMSVQISQDEAAFDTVVDNLPEADFDTETIYYKFNITLLPDTTYFWRVINHGEFGDYYSKTEWFKTRSAKPNRVSGASFNTTTGVLSWNAPTEAPADGYNIYIGTDFNVVANAGIDSEVFRGSSETNSFTFDTFDKNRLYYYRIDTTVDVDGVEANEGITTGKTETFFTGVEGLQSPPNTETAEKLVMLAGDNLLYSDLDGENVEDTGITIEDYGIDLLCAFNKCFVVNGKTKKIIDFTNTKLTIASDTSDTAVLPPRDTILYQDDTSARHAAVIDYIEVVSGTGAARVLNVYAQVVNGAFTASNKKTYWIDADGKKITWKTTAISTAPNVYDWDVYPDTVEGRKENGQMPEFASMIELYQGQVVLADSNSNIFYMSEPTNPFRFAYFEQDSGFAASVGYTGKLGQNISAVVPYRNDYLILAGKTQMWMFRGNPATGAMIDSLSNSIGIFNHYCWTFDGSGNLVIVNADGIYMLGVEVGLQNLTATVSPRFSNLFTTSDDRYLSAAFDKAENGILISSTAKSTDSTDNQSLFFSLDTGGFFEIKPATAIGGITSAIFDERRLLMGCKDGTIKYLDSDVKNDYSYQGVFPINSIVQFGVFRLTQHETLTALLETVEIYCNKESDLVLKIYTGITADAVIERIENDNANYTRNIKQARSRTFRPRLRGSYFSIAIENNLPDSTWAIERLAITGKPFGKVRIH
jgi:hypothetical protein